MITLTIQLYVVVVFLPLESLSIQKTRYFEFEWMIFKWYSTFVMIVYSIEWIWWKYIYFISWSPNTDWETFWEWKWVNFGDWLLFSRFKQMMTPIHTFLFCISLLLLCFNVKSTQIGRVICTMEWNEFTFIKV